MNHEKMKTHRAYSGTLSFKLTVVGSSPLSVVVQFLVMHTIRFEVAPTNRSQVYEIRMQPPWCLDKLSTVCKTLEINMEQS